MAKPLAKPDTVTVQNACNYNVQQLLTVFQEHLYTKLLVFAMAEHTPVLPNRTDHNAVEYTKFSMRRQSL